MQQVAKQNYLWYPLLRSKSNITSGLSHVINSAPFAIASLTPSSSFTPAPAHVCIPYFFFSSQAISNYGEISDISEEETSLRKVMLSRSKKKIFLCDSSKLGLQKTFTLYNKDEVDLIICDKVLPWE